MKSIVPCNDLLKYASLRAEPDFRYWSYNLCCEVIILSTPPSSLPNVLLVGLFSPSVLGKRLGKSMGIVAKDVKAMSQEDILAFEKAGEVTFASHCLKLTDIKVHDLLGLCNSIFLSSQLLQIIYSLLNICHWNL